MRAECVVPESQCAIKRGNKKPPARTNKNSGSPSVANTSGGTPEKRVRYGRPLKEEEGQLIDMIVALQAQFEVPSEEELKKIERYIAAFSIINPTVRKYRNRVEPLFDHTYLFLSLFMSMHLSLSSLRLKEKELYIAAICILYG